jgi:hypothetical protein
MLLPRKRDIPLKIYYSEGAGLCSVILHSHGLGDATIAKRENDDVGLLHFLLFLFSLR